MPFCFPCGMTRGWETPPALRATSPARRRSFSPHGQVTGSRAFDYKRIFVSCEIHKIRYSPGLVTFSKVKLCTFRLHSLTLSKFSQTRNHQHKSNTPYSGTYIRTRTHHSPAAHGSIRTRRPHAAMARHETPRRVPRPRPDLGILRPCANPLRKQF